jgi:Helix-turn-helix domain
MSIDATNWAWSLQDITATEKLVLLSYADRAGETMEAWPGKERLILDTCLSHNTIDKVIKSLVKKGYMIQTGEMKGKTNKIPVYQLIGVHRREDLSTNPPKSGVVNKRSNPPKIGGGNPPKSGRVNPPKIGVQNHNGNPKRNPNRERPLFSSFSSVDFFCDYIRENLIGMQLAYDDDTVDQIVFYGQKFADKRDPVDSAHIAFNQMKKKKWNIPHGWRGITSKSIREKEEAEQKEKQEQWKQDAAAAKAILGAVNIETSKAAMKQIREQLSGKRNDEAKDGGRMQEDVV